MTTETNDKSKFNVKTQTDTDSDKKQIIAVRKTSNKAFRNYDYEKIYSSLTDDSVLTTGNGTLLTSKEAFKTYKIEQSGSKMYWIRTAIDIEVNTERELAWETGTWKGYDPKQGENSVNGGKYSAMWTKESGAWLIKSQLFVTLE